MGPSGTLPEQGYHIRYCSGRSGTVGNYASLELFRTEFIVNELNLNDAIIPVRETSDDLEG